MPLKKSKSNKIDHVHGKCNRAESWHNFSGGQYLIFVVPLKDDPIGNLNTAFEVAEKYLDIPKMLDAEGE